VIDPTSGAWIYTPANADWFGSDSFIVTVTDDLGGTANQFVSVTLANVDDSSVISGDISYTGNEGDTVSGTMTATDAEGHGVANIDPVSGAWTVSLADENWFGIYQFTVTVTDDLGGTTTQLVNISLANVADIPVISGIDSGAVTEDVGMAVNILAVTGNLVIVDEDIVYNRQCRKLDIYSR